MSETQFSSFSNYKQTVLEITGDLKKIREFSQRLNLEGNVSSIDGVLKRLAEDTFNVAIVGEFKRGKSTLINALLEKDVLPTDVIPTTATLNKVTYSVTPFVRIEYNDGRTEDIDIEKLSEYVTKLTPESTKIAQSIKIATVYYPVNYCKNGVTIIDTPGLNDEDSMTQVTLSVLPQADAAIMVMMAGSPFSQYECDFLENKIIASDLGRVLFVVTGIDLYDEDDGQKILNLIKKRITDSVLAKARRTYGEDSKEYAAYQRKLGSIHVYGLSAKKALKAKQKGDPDMLAKSRFPEFESALERFLTEDRGAVMLNVPLNRIKMSSVELIKAAQLRESALTMRKEEFDAKYERAMEEIKKIQTERQNEFNRISLNAKQTYQNLIPTIQNYWPSILKAADEVVDNYPITSVKELKGTAGQETQEAITKAVRDAICRTSQDIMERIQVMINDALVNEAERLSSFENNFYQATELIQELFVSVSGQDGSGVELALGVVASSIGGNGVLGGIYLGYKQAGWKGALLGGGTSFAGSMASAYGLGMLIGALAIPLTWPVLLVTTVGAGIIGTFAGKWAVGTIFAQDQILKFKQSFKKAIHEELNCMKEENDISDLVRAQIESAFDALKDKIRTETENILGDTHNQLTQLKVELAQADSMDTQERKALKQMMSELEKISSHADTISRELTLVLARQEGI